MQGITAVLAGSLRAEDLGERATCRGLLRAFCSAWPEGQSNLLDSTLQGAGGAIDLPRDCEIVLRRKPCRSEPRRHNLQAKQIAYTAGLACIQVLRQGSSVRGQSAHLSGRTIPRAARLAWQACPASRGMQAALTMPIVAPATHSFSPC